MNDARTNRTWVPQPDHMHGGQVYAPGLGTPVLPSRYGQEYSRGLVQGPACPVYISCGVGMALLPVRIGVLPEIALVQSSSHTRVMTIATRLQCRATVHVNAGIEQVPPTMAGGLLLGLELALRPVERKDPAGPVGEIHCIKGAFGILRRTYGPTPGRDFGPLALQVVREKMVGEGWSRNYINAQVGRIKRMFKWAARQELIPPSVFHASKRSMRLRKGKTEAREDDPVKPVPDLWVEATIRTYSRQVEPLIRLQLARGMRPGEACIMRGCDLDTTGTVWTYRPQKHETEHRGDAVGSEPGRRMFTWG